MRRCPHVTNSIYLFTRIKNIDMSKDRKTPQDDAAKEKDFPGYPPYPKKDDIYNKEEEESLDESEEKKDPKTRTVDGENISMENGMDVPGSELDDENEEIGEEDEENNYYSLGGDNHDDPEPEK